MGLGTWRGRWPLPDRPGITGGLGADVAVEAVGLPGTFQSCTRLVRPGGRISNVGVHGMPATLPLEDLWSRNVTHRFALTDIVDAYDTFAGAADTGPLKVVLAETSA